MEQRRFLLFITLSMAILIGWNAWLAPLFFPPAPKNPAAQAQNDAAAKDDADQPVVAPRPGESTATAEPAPSKLADHPERTVKIGSLDPATGYFMQAELSSRGAAVNALRLNDPRYTELTDRKLGLNLVGGKNGKGEPSPLHTLETGVAAVDTQLAEFKTNLREVNWEVVEEMPDATVKDAEGNPVNSRVVFAYRAPDGSVELRKTYELGRIPGDEKALRDAREVNPVGYELRFTISAQNLSNNDVEMAYTLVGPTGMPLENLENTRKYREVEVGFLNGPGDVSSVGILAGKVVEQADEQQIEQWKKPLQYIGVEIQYFAALLMPQGDQLNNSYVEVAQPILVERDPAPAQSDVSVQLTSKTTTLAPGQSLEHTYALYAGPKRQSLLEPLGASGVMDFGWTGFIARPMLALLQFLNDLGVGYGVAIIMLTMIVRACMFPVSRKQALNAKHMKELQPKIAELKKKYGDDKEKLARAQWELMRKHNYNPASGCLPLLIQLPIFIGLYNSLMNSVDLRLAEFLWIDNLAAPDRLFEMPFRLPYLGDDFNLLPLITVALFYFQQKMFMPPPANEEQELQYKIMNFAMLFMGVLFYHVPAGLCVYFIASSLWGMGERKLLDFTGASSKSSSAGQSDSGGDGPGNNEPRDDGRGGGGSKRATVAKKDAQPAKPNGFFARIMAAAQEAAAEAQERAQSGSSKPRGPERTKKSKSRR